MTDSEKLKALEAFLEDSFYVISNMNDTFYYACADQGEIESGDLKDLIEYYPKYGYAVAVAYEAIKRDHDPQISQLVTKEYKEIKQILIERMKENENFIPGLNYDFRKWNKQVEEYGGRLEFKFVNPSEERKAEGQECQTCICSIVGRDEKGYATNMANAEKDLRAKLGLDAR